MPEERAGAQPRSDPAVMLGPHRPKVVVVGAGAAGLAAASRLVQSSSASFQPVVVVLEAQRQPGGRIRTVHWESGQVELGAQWIHGRGENPLWTLAKEHGLVDAVQAPPSTEGEGLFFTSQGTMVDSNLVCEIRDVVETANKQCTEFTNIICAPEELPKSVEHYFRQCFNDHLKRNRSSEDSEKTTQMKRYLFEWFLKWYCLDNACPSLSRVSAATWGEFETFEGEHWNNVVDGYDSVLATLLDTIQEPHGKVQCGKPVNTIYWSSTPALVHCDTGDVITADHVIVTCSVGYLQEHHATMFRPPLPKNKQTVIQNMGFGVLDKIFLFFDQCYWDSNERGFQFVWTDDDLVPDADSWCRDITGFDTVICNPGVLVGWIGCRGAEVMENLSEEHIGTTCTRLLRRFTNNPDIPDPLRVVRSRWRSNRFIRGSYSYRTNESDRAGSLSSDFGQPVSVTGNAEKPIPRLLFAGEATSVNYYSTVHGAMMSGYREADRIVEFYTR